MYKDKDETTYQPGQLCFSSSSLLALHILAFSHPSSSESETGLVLRSWPRVTKQTKPRSAEGKSLRRPSRGRFENASWLFGLLLDGEKSQKVKEVDGWWL